MKTYLKKKNPLFFLQIGSLENYYHFHHSKTFKRSTLSSRGPHNFLRMDPKVRGWAPWCPPASVGWWGEGPHLSPEDAGGLIRVKRELEHLGMTLLPLSHSPVHTRVTHWTRRAVVKNT